MANEHGLFWNSQNGDRVYDANDFSEWLKKFYTTGVFNGDLEVTAAGGMTVSVSSGYVNIEGKVKFFSTPTTLTLATASGTYGRIDTVVAECNYTDREIKLKVVTGTYSVSPTATAPVRTAAAYQLVLAQIDVAAGAAEITQKNITDKRMDSNVCGLVTGTVSQIDFAGVEAQFNAWFENVKNTLGTDSAGNLKNQIDAINDKIGTTDISSIGDGTETGAISANASNISQTQAAITALNSSLSKRFTLLYSLESTYDGARSLSIDLSPYKMVLIVCKRQDTGADLVSFVIPVSIWGNVEVAHRIECDGYYRIVTISTTSIKWGTANGEYPTAFIVPIKIYGL